MDILSKIIKAKTARVAERKKTVSPKVIEAQAKNSAPPARNFLEAISTPTNGHIHIIAEVKKASPSRGVIREDFHPLDIARAYAAGGASALSVLTEEDFFQGSDAYLEEISRAVALPVLRKDFTVDAYQIYEAKCLGASAFLLIAACLSPSELAAFIALGKSLGLTPLVEAHTAGEIHQALEAGAAVIGINNRNLKTFHTSMETTYRLRPLIPKSVTVISESGIFTRDDMRNLAHAGVQAALIGESLIREQDIAGKLRELLSFS